MDGPTLCILWPGYPEERGRVTAPNDLVGGCPSPVGVHLGPSRPPIRGGQVMPIFEFECVKCDTMETIVRSFQSDTVPVCWKCGAKMVIRWSAPAVLFKGGGWAKKDRAGKGGQ